METVNRQTLALWLGDGDEQHALESDTTGLNVKENLYFYLSTAQSLPAGTEESLAAGASESYNSAPTDDVGSVPVS